MILESTGTTVSDKYERYFGLPALVGHSEYITFRKIKERVWSKINSWKNIFLSQAGKEIFFKIVLQAIPTYTMTVFKLPKNLCNKINVMLSRFWWSSQQKENKI